MRPPGLFPRQLVARIEPGDALLEEGVALGLEGFRRVEGIELQVDLVGASGRLVGDGGSAARAMTSRHAGGRMEGRPFTAERDLVVLEVHEAGHRRSRMPAAAGAVAVGDPARLASGFEGQLTTQAMSACHFIASLARIGSWCLIRA